MNARGQFLEKVKKNSPLPLQVEGGGGKNRLREGAGALKKSRSLNCSTTEGKKDLGRKKNGQESGRGTGTGSKFLRTNPEVREGERLQNKNTNQLI